MAASAEISRQQFLDAWKRQEDIRRQVQSLSDVADGFLTLTAAGPAPLGLENTGNRSFQIFWTLTGCPSVTLPRLAVDGLPVGLQVLGFRDRDADLASLALWIDRLLAA